MKQIRTLIRPAAAGTLAAAVLLLSGASTSAAAPAAPAVPPAYSAGQLAAARAVAGSDTMLAVLGRFFAHAPGLAAGAAEAAPPRLTGAGTTVYTLNADFVAGRAGAPVAKPAFVATEAVSADGRRASVWTVRTAHGWQVVNIASGADETAYPAEAHGRGTVFREPQINAWYLLRGERLLPLNPEARAAIGADGATVDGYRRHVRSAYGSRLAGSAYDREGYAGGFGRESAAAATAAADRESGPDTGVLAGVAGAALALGGALGGRRLLRGPGSR
ncbi:hypothetical protein [Streptomyces sp. NPDC086766]|uniref:hypothetical protein n=1 Tax=Streptomyces sp. NPDC086766 TaxID=3365754 RepID=UPI00382A691E